MGEEIPVVASKMPTVLKLEPRGILAVFLWEIFQTALL
tara:strand:- start:22 stop:135 length:114 start_codon:yes stop_codon:yes gene_type:complete